MATWTIQISAQSGQGSGATGTHATTLGEAIPGDFDGSTINSVTVSGSPATTVSGAGNDDIGVWFIIETSTGTDIYGTSGADSTTMCYAPLSPTGSTIVDGTATSPAPTTAVAADWDNVNWAINYSNNSMPDGQTLGWSQFNVVVDYTATTPLTEAPPVGTLTLAGQAPTLTVNQTIAVTAGAISFNGAAPDPGENHVRGPSVGSLETAGQVPTRPAGLLFRGHVPTLSEGESGTNRQPGFGTLTLSGLVPQARAAFDAAPPAGAASFAGQIPDLGITRSIEVSIGGLTATGQVPVAGEDHLATPASGSLNINGIAPSFNWSILATAGSATTAGQAPTLVVTRSIDVSSGSLTFSGQAPTAQEDHVATPTTGSLTATGQAPTLSEDHLATPGTGTLTLTGQTPTVTVTRAIEVPTGSATLTGAAPTLSEDHLATPTTGTLTLTGQIPDVVGEDTIVVATGSLIVAGQSPIVGENHLAAPATGSLIVAGQSPAVVENNVITPATGGLVVAGKVPLLVEGESEVISPDTGSLALSGSAPTAISPVTISPSTGSLVLGGDFPAWYETRGIDAATVTFTGHIPIAEQNPLDPNVVPPGSGTFAGKVPTLQQTALTQPEPGVGGLLLQGSAPTRAHGLLITGHAPLLVLPQQITVTSGSVSFTGAAPTIQLQQTIIPGAGSLTLSGSTPTLAFENIVLPDTGNLTLAGAAPSLGEDHVVTPASGALSFAGAAPSALTTTLIPVSTGALALTGGAPQPITSGLLPVPSGALTIQGQAPTTAVPDVDVAAAVETFPTGSTVTITVHEPATLLQVALDDNSCPEIGSTGSYVWHSGKLSIQPVGYKQYVWVMMDGISSKNGIIEINHAGVADILGAIIENNETFAEQLRLIRANAAGDIVQQADGSYVIKSADGIKSRIVGEPTDNGGRDITATNTQPGTGFDSGFDEGGFS